MTMMRMNYNIAAVSVGLVLLSSVSTAQAQSSSSSCPSLQFQDEFDGSALNETIWTPQIGNGCERGPNLCGWGNAEPQYYLADNAQVVDGMLQITAKEEATQGFAYTSARLRTLDKVEVDLTQPTYIEARIQVPSGGQGIWPAFWLLPTPEVTWPLGGEIDIMEFIGREPFLGQGYAHYGAAFGDKSQVGGPMAFPEPLYEQFHTFGLLKTPNRMSWLIDGYEYQVYTPSDVEPKYSWPFENTYHIILNLAAGGHWPGWPDETSIFPTTMEVDYIRVYDIQDETSIPTITGTRLVSEGATEVEYCVENKQGASTISWDVPGDATFVDISDSNLDCILVDFGVASGYVQTTLSGSDCSETADTTLSIPVQVQASYGVAQTVWDATVEPTLATGTYESVVQDNVAGWKYTRTNLELYDTIQLEDVDLTDHLDDLVDGQAKFYLTIQTTTAAPCTQVMVQLEDSTMATPTNFAIGRHSRYQCLLEPMSGQWQRVACDYIDRPDRTVTSVDKVVLLIDPSLVRSDVYYFEKVDVATAGCTSNCEALQSNGPSTDNCRRAAKSEAGACNDDLNNDWEGYNGNLVGDCADPQCFLIDPQCGGPAVPEGSPAPSSTLTPSAAPSTLTPTSMPTLTPSAAPSTLTPTSMLAPSSSPTDLDTTPEPSSTPSIEPTHPPVPGDTPAPTTTPSASPAPSTSELPGTSPAPTQSIFDGPAECALNEACVGLADDCCPTATDNVYLWCCFEDAPIPTAGYAKEFSFVGPQTDDERATYFISSAPYFDPGTAPDGTFPVVAYERSPTEEFDLIYYETSSIPNAREYIDGTKRFYMDVWSTANECTQILLQLDSLPLAAADNFPTGRHSRFVAFTTVSNAWERVEFVYLDQPDATVDDASINAMVLFFDPSSLRDDTYYFRNLDSAVDGCNPTVENCEDTSPKSCPAFFSGETGDECSDEIDNDLDGKVDCEDSDCMLEGVCSTTISRSYASAQSLLRVQEVQTRNSEAANCASLSTTILLVALVIVGAGQSLLV